MYLHFTESEVGDMYKKNQPTIFEDVENMYVFEAKASISRRANLG